VLVYPPKALVQLEKPCREWKIAASERCVLSVAQREKNCDGPLLADRVLSSGNRHVRKQGLIARAKLALNPAVPRSGDLTRVKQVGTVGRIVAATGMPRAVVVISVAAGVTAARIETKTSGRRKLLAGPTSNQVQCLRRARAAEGFFSRRPH
jgi:hypothetical protein